MRREKPQGREMASVAMTPASTRACTAGEGRVGEGETATEFPQRGLEELMPNGKTKEISAANFPTPKIAITPKWVGKEAKLAEFSEWSAKTAKKARAQLA